jgi:hypothetical protein
VARGRILPSWMSTLDCPMLRRPTVSRRLSATRLAITTERLRSSGGMETEERRPIGTVSEGYVRPCQAPKSRLIGHRTRSFGSPPAIASSTFTSVAIPGVDRLCACRSPISSLAIADLSSKPAARRPFPKRPGPLWRAPRTMEDIFQTPLRPESMRCSFPHPLI